MQGLGDPCISKLGIDWGILLIPLALFDVSQQMASSSYYFNQNVTKVYRNCGLFLSGTRPKKTWDKPPDSVIISPNREEKGFAGIITK